MSRRYSKWYIRIANGLAVLVSAATVVAGPIDDARNAAANIGAQALGRYGTKDASNINISVPMTNSATLFRTVDGSTTFSANLTSPSSSKFLEMLIQPGVTGDLQQVIIGQDLNTDGSFDYSYSVPRPVSGVCANGYISCDAGTWANCTAYKWISNTSGQVSDSSTELMHLGGCYCINASCGSSLVWTNSGIILKDLAGGALAAIQNANVMFTITNVSFTPVSIDYYGNVTGNSPTGIAPLAGANIVVSPPVSVLQSYFVDTTAMSSGAISAAQTQALVPNSLYSNMLSLNQSGDKADCTIKRNEIEATRQNFCSDPPFPNQLNESQQHSYVKMDTGIVRSGDNYGSCYWTGIIDGIGCFPYSATTVTSLPQGAQPTGQQAADAFSCISESFCTYHVFDYYDICVRLANVLDEAIDNQCAALENNTNCQLDSETVDDVQTLANGVATGLNPLPKCQMVNVSAGQLQICRPWWVKKRTYVCHNTQAWDFSDAKKRFGVVVGSVNTGGSYSDIIKDSTGTWISRGGSLDVPTLPPVSSCELSCKTRMTTGSTQVSLNTKISDLRSDPSAATDYAYKLCANNVCPLDTGEEIVENCQCLNEFNQAAMAIQTIRMAGKDMICTSGVPKPMY